MKTLLTTLVEMDEEQLHEVFKLIDSGNKGYITCEDLRAISRIDCNVEQVANLLNLGPNSSLSFDKFKRKILSYSNSNNNKENVKPDQYEAVGESVKHVKKTLTPKRRRNGGDSDAVDDIVNRFKSLLNRMEDIFEQSYPGKSFTSADEMIQRGGNSSSTSISRPLRRSITPESLSVEAVATSFGTLVDERNSQRRLEVTELEKSNLKLQLDLASERIELADKSLQVTSLSLSSFELLNLHFESHFF